MSSLRTLSVAFSSFLVFGCVNLLTQHSMTGAPARAFAMPNPLPQTTIPASNCQAMPVLCCQEVEPLKDLISEVESILDGAGITLPDLETLVGIDCNPTLLGLPCSASPVCCTTDIPTSGDLFDADSTGVFCTPVVPII